MTMFTIYIDIYNAFSYTNLNNGDRDHRFTRTHFACINTTFNHIYHIDD